MFASFQSSGRQPNLSDLLNNSEYRPPIISNACPPKRIPSTLVKGIVKHAGNFDFAFDPRQRWSQRYGGCDYTFDAR